MNINPGFTKLCKGLAVVLIGGHIVVQIPTAVSYLALIPAKYSNFALSSLFFCDYLLFQFFELRLYGFEGVLWWFS